jgi:membrane protein required for colicin V production
MQGYDLLMIVVLVAAVIWGAWKGFAWQVASLGSMIASYIVALTFRQQLAQHINATPPWNMFLAMLILFLGTSLVVWLGFNLIAEGIEKVKLKEFDRQIGALFGLAKGVLLCVLITLFGVTLLSDSQRQAICSSRSGYYIAILLDKADGVIPGELHQVIEPYLDRLENEIDHPHTDEGFHLPEQLLGRGGEEAEPTDPLFRIPSFPGLGGAGSQPAETGSTETSNPGTLPPGMTPLSGTGTSGFSGNGSFETDTARGGAGTLPTGSQPRRW